MHRTHTYPARAGHRQGIDRPLDTVDARLEDAAPFPAGHADGVVRPRNEADVARLVRTAARVLVVGALSSVTGGATLDGGLVLSTDRRSSLHETGQPRFRAEAGLPLEALQILLRGYGRWYAPVPTCLGDVGGNRAP